MCCEEKVSQFINHPVMSLFDTGMIGTSTEMVSHRVQLELPPTTSRYKFSEMTEIWTRMVMVKKV
jgi:hypothetical protein